MAFSDFLPMITSIVPDPMMGMAQMQQMRVPNATQAARANYFRLGMLHRMAAPVGGRLPVSGRGRSAPGVGGELAMTPELMQGMDVDKINQQLAPFGVQLPANPNPNAFLPNTGFFGNHPGAAAGLEGFLLGAMGTRDADTWGEGISNAIRGGVGAVESRRAAVNAQYTTPLDMAHTLGQLTLNQSQLQNYMDMHNLHNMQMKNIESEITARENKPDPKLYGNPVVSGTTGNWAMPDMTTGALKDTGILAGKKPGSGVKPNPSQASILSSMGLDPGQFPEPGSDESQLFQKRWFDYQASLAGAKAGAGEGAKNPRRTKEDDMAIAKQNLHDANKALEEFDKQKPSQLYANYKAYEHSDPAVQAARAPLLKAAQDAAKRYNSFSSQNEGAPSVNPADPANLFGK